MSAERGNAKRSRSQKHQNSSSFKNNLYDKSKQTKFINSLQISDVCGRCKSILEWKIKYKKYKLLKNPTTCVKCKGRNVTQSYRTICQSCADKLRVCPKCGKHESEWNSEYQVDDNELISSDDDEENRGKHQGIIEGKESDDCG